MDTISTAPVSPRVARPTARLSRLRDESLAVLAGRGSEQAFGALYERYHHALYRCCRSILRNDADAQDALQSAFTSGLAALQRGQRNAPVRPWLFRIAHNEACESGRAGRARPVRGKQMARRSMRPTREIAPDLSYRRT
jgi:RNA polymerase sigma factor (sigma-70 family)